VSPEFVRVGAQLAAAEMIRGGVTMFNDMYFFPESVAQVIAEVGMRGVVGITVLDFPSAYAKTADEYVTQGMQVYEKYKDHHLIK
jgi:5-methylthioadenosine/S-adenosylhomocysteine deaminase